MLESFAPYSVAKNIISLFKDEVKTSENKHTSKHTYTKCKYCGRSYHHVLYGPNVVVYNINEYDFNPKLKSKMQDSRRPFNCDSCGAEVMLYVENL